MAGTAPRPPQRDAEDGDIFEDTEYEPTNQGNLEKFGVGVTQNNNLLSLLSFPLLAAAGSARIMSEATPSVNSILTDQLGDHLDAALANQEARSVPAACAYLDSSATTTTREHSKLHDSVVVSNLQNATPSEENEATLSGRGSRSQTASALHLAKATSSHQPSASKQAESSKKNQCNKNNNNNNKNNKKQQPNGDQQAQLKNQNKTTGDLTPSTNSAKRKDFDSSGRSPQNSDRAKKTSRSESDP